MQKRFVPDEGGVFPEWEEIEFGKLFQRRSEKNGEEFGVDKTISVATMHFKPEGNKADEKSLPKYKVMRTGDIAFEGHINKHFKHGRFVLNDIGDGIISPIFEVLQPVSELSKEVPGFWKYYINYEPVMGKILAKCANTGIMMNRLAIKDFYKQKIKVPCIEEQRKIAAALAAYDEMIAVKTAKLETWQECKKRMVKEIFGRTKRFRDDDGNEFPEWEEKTLGEVCKYGNTHKIGKNYIKVENMNKDFSGVTFLEPSLEKKSIVYGIGDVLMSNIRPYLRKAWLADRGGVCDSDVLVFHLKDGVNVDSTFLYYTIASSEFVKWSMIGARGTKMPRCDKQHLLEKRIFLPCMTEQQKIGSFLAEIDKEIEIQKEFIKTYAEGKKRMMSELMEG